MCQQHQDSINCYATNNNTFPFEQARGKAFLIHQQFWRLNFNENTKVAKFTGFMNGSYYDCYKKLQKTKIVGVTSYCVSNLNKLYILEEPRIKYVYDGPTKVKIINNNPLQFLMVSFTKVNGIKYVSSLAYYRSITSCRTDHGKVICYILRHTVDN